jgi:competence protein ComFB
MDIHNTTEDIVFSSIKTIFSEIQKSGNVEKFCLCEQCQLDTVCYVLNRMEPHYIVSNRGITRIEQDSVTWQQVEADIASLIYRGLRVVNHNQRPTAPHDGSAVEAAGTGPAFDIPVIVGRLFDGVTFAPLSGVTVRLCGSGGSVSMRNLNWQNPFTLVSNTPGTFTFWPAPVPAVAADIHETFEYSLKIEAPGYETLIHFFKIPTVSLVQTPYSYSLDRTFKLPDLYLFPPGEAEKNGYVD